MNTTELKKFAQVARRQLIEQVEARLDLVLQTDSAELREQKKAVKQLREEIAKSSKKAVVERVAYLWFNRFCALRFMDVNRYTRIGTVSPAEGFFQPEILQDAKQGHIDDELQVDQKKVFDLLGGQTVSADPQQEAYRLLLVAVCNSYHKLMPFMFQRISDYSELLMPDDLLSENSVLTSIRAAISREVISSQSSVEVSTAFRLSVSQKDGGKAATDNCPLKTDNLRISSPEEIRICDPACGSGHMLTYAFDLLYAIYEEEGYDSSKIPQLILTNNLYGIEIDERAGELAAFALMMKARAKDRRFFRRKVKPNICVLQNIELSSLSDQLSAVSCQ